MRRDSVLARRNAARRTPRYASLALHWLGRLLRRPAAVQPSTLASIGGGQVALRWGGHASALIRYADLTIACDPMLGGFIGGVRREVGAALPADELAEVQLVLVGHIGPGRLHLPTLESLPRSATVVVPPGAGYLVSPLGFARLIELMPEQSFGHRGVDVTAVAVRHGEPGQPGLAYVVRGDGPSVFHCGDSGYFAGFTEIGRRFRPDVALLPIGGYAGPGFRARHMSPLDALAAFEDLRARLMVPIRHGAFALSYEKIGDPAGWMAELVAGRQLEAHVLLFAPGEARVFALPGASRAPPPAEAPEAPDDTQPMPPIAMDEITRTDDGVPVAIDADPHSVDEPLPG